MTHERKAAGSMVFWIDSLLRDSARMFADVGVRNISELRELLADQRIELLRIVSPEARTVGTAYKSG
ncbi:hypothetical protein MUP56_01020 [Patescibacteria group bacterium]|nr:hypothetical protein [Patescibacteria group bacterium]